MPPNAGPEIEPIDINIEMTANASARVASGKYSLIIPIELAIIIAEPTAWTTRPAMMVK